MVTFMRKILWKDESTLAGVSGWVWPSARPWGSRRNVAEDKASEMRAKFSWNLPCIPASTALHPERLHHRFTEHFRGSNEYFQPRTISRTILSNHSCVALV